VWCWGGVGFPPPGAAGEAVATPVSCPGAAGQRDASAVGGVLDAAGSPRGAVIAEERMQKRQEARA
jgi:hypothetical protein